MVPWASLNRQLSKVMIFRYLQRRVFQSDPQRSLRPNFEHINRQTLPNHAIYHLSGPVTRFPCRDIAFWSLDVHFHLGFIKRGPGMIWNNNSHGESNPTFGKVKTISVDCDFQHTIDSYWLDEYPCSDLRVLIHVHYSTNLRKVTFYWFWTTGMDTAPEQSPELSS